MKIKLDGLELNLTSEQVEDLKRQLEVKQETLPTTWLEAFEIVKPKWYLSSSGGVANVIEIQDTDYQSIYYSHVPTDKHVKSVRAMCQLMTIAEAYNQGIDGDFKYMIDRNVDEDKITVCDGSYLGNPILFKKEEHAEHCLEHFKELWNDFFMI